jgi:cyclin-dependent kinase inhibitor 3 (CDKN3)
MFEQVGCNFLVLYSEHNLETISLPICDYGVPAQRPLGQAINKTIGYARLKHNTLIHCSAGIGRTAFFAAFLGIEVLKLSSFLRSPACSFLARYLSLHHAI